MSYSLVLPFDTDSLDFIRGVEIGRLWEMLKQEDGELSITLHVENSEMVLRIAEATGRTVRARDYDEETIGWMTVTFGRKGE